MNIAIWGAGGIGCYYGIKLKKAGHHVTFIARGEHLNAMQTQGLTLQHASTTYQGPVDAIHQSTWANNYTCNDFDLIILCLKSTVTATVMDEMSDWLKQGTCPLLSLQNGVDNEAQIAAVIGQERTLGGLAVRIGGHIITPGHVEVDGVAQVIFGQWPNSQHSVDKNQLTQIYNLFTAADIDTELSDDIRQALWRKLLINNGVNPLSALTELDTRQITSDPQLSRTVYTMMEEVALAARYDDVSLSKEDIDEMFTLISNFDAIKTSMLVDLEKGKPLERDAISGAVIRRCLKLNAPATTTALIDTLLRIKCDKLNAQQPAP